MKTRLITLELPAVAARAGFVPGPDGRLNLPPDDNTVAKLKVAAKEMLLPWNVGDPAIDVILTGQGPVWAHLAIAHGISGLAQRLRYAAPNCPLVKIWGAGFQADE